MEESKKEILEQLRIENEDEDYEESMEKLESEIEDEEELHLPKIGSPLAKTYSVEHMTSLSRKGAEVRQSNAAIRLAHKRSIVREAFNQKDIALSTPLNEEMVEKIVYLATSKRRLRITKAENYIRHRVTEILSAQLPRVVKSCWNQFPQAMMPSPGFSYVASKEYGQGIEYWIQPDVPAFFEQGTEVAILRKAKRDILFKIEKEIVKYKENHEKLAKEIARYKWDIRMMQSKTFAGLLTLKPVWFEKIYIELTGKELCKDD